MKLILRPLMPPCSLIIRKYAASVLPMVAYDDAGPLYGMMLPILISVSVAPVSYFFCARAWPPVAASNARAAERAPSRKWIAGILVSLDHGGIGRFSWNWGAFGRLAAFNTFSPG